jgi:hypothetical protein
VWHESRVLALSRVCESWQNEARAGVEGECRWAWMNGRWVSIYQLHLYHKPVQTGSQPVWTDL